MASTVKMMKNAVRPPWASKCSYILKKLNSICLQVAANIEAREEHDHGDHVGNHQVVHPSRNLAIAPRSNKAVQTFILDQIHYIHVGDDEELDELELGEVRSPPALHLQHTAQVVGIHEHVDEGVGDHKNAVITSRVGHEEETNNSSNTTVVIHVQEGHLTEGLAEDEEEGIEVLPVLLDIVNVDELGMRRNRNRRSYMSDPLGVLAVEIDSLTSKRVSLLVVEPDHSDKAVSSQTNASEVVENHEFAGINGLSLLHNLSQHVNRDEIEDVEINHGLDIRQREGLQVVVYNNKDTNVIGITELKVPNNGGRINSEHPGG